MKKSKHKPSTQNPRQWRACPACHGSGKNEWAEPPCGCNICNGRGKVLVDPASPYGHLNIALEWAFTEIANSKD